MNFFDKEENRELMSENRVIIDKITEFLKRNVKYVSKSAMIVALASVLMLTGCNEPKENGGQEKAQTEQGQTPAPTEEAGQPEVKNDEYEVDAHPEVKELVSTYYNSYAAGDIDKLLAITQSLSDMEKSYVKMMNEYVESYSDVTCYTKEGLEEGSFMVSATFNMNCTGVEGGLPGMDFFYIRTDKDGKIYIDNRYSSFNRNIKEQETEPEVDALIEEFEGGEDVQKLRNEFQEKYDAAVAGNENLKQMANTVSEAIKQWKDSYKPEEEQKEESMNIRNGFNFAKKVLVTGECNLLILDSFLELLDNHMVSEEDLQILMNAKSEDTELMLTGKHVNEALGRYALKIYEIHAD